MIEQIVLDVLKGKSNEAMWGYQVADKGLYITENKFEDIAKSIADKISAVSVDRDKVNELVRKLLERKLHEHYGCMEMVEFKSWENGIDTDDINELSDQICNLAIPEPKLISRSNLSKPFDYKIKEGGK